MKYLMAVIIAISSCVALADESKSLCVKKDLFVSAHGTVLEAGKYDQEKGTDRVAYYSVSGQKNDSFKVDFVRVRWHRQVQICLYSGDKKPFCGYYSEPPFEKCL